MTLRTMLVHDGDNPMLWRRWGCVQDTAPNVDTWTYHRVRAIAHWDAPAMSSMYKLNKQTLRGMLVTQAEMHRGFPERDNVEMQESATQTFNTGEASTLTCFVDGLVTIAGYQKRWCWMVR